MKLNEFISKWLKYNDYVEIRAKVPNGVRTIYAGSVEWIPYKLRNDLQYLSSTKTSYGVIIYVINN